MRIGGGLELLDSRPAGPGGTGGLQDPLNWPSAWGGEFDWAYQTTPQPGLDGVVVPQPRGKGLGGCTIINVMVHVRAHQSSYDAWARAGATGWDSTTLLPYFKRSETAAGMDPKWRGQNGPMIVDPLPPAAPGSFYAATYEAFCAAGFKDTDDGNGNGNGKMIEGLARTELNLVDGVRQTAADVYVRPVLDRANLTVVTGAFARRLVISHGRCEGGSTSPTVSNRTGRRRPAARPGASGHAQHPGCGPRSPAHVRRLSPADACGNCRSGAVG